MNSSCPYFLDYLVRKAKSLEQGFYLTCQKELVCLTVAVEAKDPGDTIITCMYYKSILPEPGASVHVGLSSLTDTHFAVLLVLRRSLKCGSALSSLAVLNIRKKENMSKAFGSSKYYE